MITEAPRGAIWAADLYVAVSKLLQSFTSYMLRDRPFGPDDCENAQELRAYANRIMHREPGFAQDLIAAIDREEQK